MSNRRRLKPTNPFSHSIRGIDGMRIEGGCDFCDAYQRIRSDHHGPDIHSITVYHDDACPSLRGMPSLPAQIRRTEAES